MDIAVVSVCLITDLSSLGSMRLRRSSGAELDSEYHLETVIGQSLTMNYVYSLNLTFNHSDQGFRRTDAGSHACNPQLFGDDQGGFLSDSKSGRVGVLCITEVS